MDNDLPLKYRVTLSREHKLRVEMFVDKTMLTLDREMLLKQETYASGQRDTADLLWRAGVMVYVYTPRCAHLRLFVDKCAQFCTHCHTRIENCTVHRVPDKSLWQS